MRRRALVSSRLSGVAMLAATAVLAGCGGSTSGNAPSTASATRRGAPTAEAGGLPFTYQAPGESSSPSFAVATTGTYAVTYHLSAEAGGPCTSAIDLVSGEGASASVVGRTDVAPDKPADGTVEVNLAAGTWRFQAAGGCAWKVSVAARA